MPAAAFRVDRVTQRNDGQVTFESAGFSRSEDARRARGLCTAANRGSAVMDPDDARHLAAQLGRGAEGGEYPESLASSLCMRKHRIRVVGALWRLMMEGR